MDEKYEEIIGNYIGKNHAKRAIERKKNTEERFLSVLRMSILPEHGLSEAEIEAIILQLALLDSNNWTNSVGVGEREGRILVNLVKKRHFGLAHGVGRSGDITAIQPKAPGSSLLNCLLNRLLLNWLQRSGAKSTARCFLVPMATGMTLTLCLLALKRRRPNAKYVIWPRIDQKSCFKSIIAAGLTPVVIEPQCRSARIKRKAAVCPRELADECPADQLSTDLTALEVALQKPAGLINAASGSEDVVCVFTTTSCFAPRVPDHLSAVSRLCAAHRVPHLINNAYGVQAGGIMRKIEAAWKTSLAEGSQIDLLYVQSTDKNLLVPVGGAIVAGFSTELVKFVAESYPGRASSIPAVDVFITLLNLGWGGWQRLVVQRELCYNRLSEGLSRLASSHGLRVMRTPDNPISLALSIQGLVDTSRGDCQRQLIQLGSRLFTQGCSGVRVVIPATMEALVNPEGTKISGLTFHGFNSHSNTSSEPYLNAAAAIGQTVAEVDLFLERLDKALSRFHSAASSEPVDCLAGSELE